MQSESNFPWHSSGNFFMPSQQLTGKTATQTLSLKGFRYSTFVLCWLLGGNLCPNILGFEKDLKKKRRLQYRIVHSYEKGKNGKHRFVAEGHCTSQSPFWFAKVKSKRTHGPSWNHFRPVTICSCSWERLLQMLLGISRHRRMTDPKMSQQEGSVRWQNIPAAFVRPANNVLLSWIQLLSNLGYTGTHHPLLI